MSIRVGNGGSPVSRTQSSEEVEAPKPPPLPKLETPRQEVRDGFDQATVAQRRNLIDPTVAQLKTDAPKMTLAELMRTGGSSAPSERQVEGLVKDAYAQVLMREPDAGGAQVHKDKAMELVRQGASAEDVRNFLKEALSGSPEGQAIGAVNRQFESELNRTPETKGYWHEQALEWAGQGVPMEEINKRLQTELHASPERALNHPEEFLGREYQRLLGREVDGEGLAHFGAKMQEMNAAGASFGDIQKSIEQEIQSSPEFKARQAQQASPTTGVGGLAQSDAELASRVNKHLEGTGLAGKGETIVATARKERVPVELMMSMLQKESSFLSKENNLSIANNNPGNLRFAEWERDFGGQPGGPGGFTTFPSVDKGIEAMGHLLGTVYREQVDARDWKGLVNKYCPPFDQPGGQADTDLYVKQMGEWTQNWQNKLGVDSNWVNTPPTGSAAPAAGTTPSTGPANPSPASLKGITPSQITDAARFPDQWSLCGPIAATAAARALGKNVTLDQAREVGMRNGNYGYDEGMRGPESQVRMMRDLGMQAHTENPVNWDKVKEQLAQGRPVIMSTPKHYFVIEGYNAQTGKFDCGNSALAMKASGGTQTELSPAELANWGGGAPTAIVLD